MDQLSKELKSYDDFNKSIFEVAKLVNEYGQGEEVSLYIDKLRNLLVDSERQKGTVSHSYQLYEEIKTLFDKNEILPRTNMQERFDVQLSKFPPLKSGIIGEFDKFIRDSDNSLSNIIIPESTQEILDPWTKLPIKHQVKSKLCQHIYDKASVDCKIKSNKGFRCPYIGCVAQLTKADLFIVNDI